MSGEKVSGKWDGFATWLEAEVVVCGGGTAGAFAAIAAAMEGAGVLLIEAMGGLGGTPVAGLVVPMMTVRMTEARAEGEPEPRCSYLDHELTRRLDGYGAQMREGYDFDPLVLGAVLEQMCQDSGVKLLLQATVCGAEQKDGRISAIYVACRDSVHKIEGKVFVDCTGDGALAVAAGAGFEAGQPRTGINQPMSLRYMVGGVDLDKLGAFFDSFPMDWSAYSARKGERNIYAAVSRNGKGALQPLFRQAMENGDLIAQDLEYWQLFGVVGRDDTIALNNPEFFDYTNAADPLQLTAVLLEGKKAILRQLKFYRKYFPGCENAYVSAIASMVGIRESRRVHTKYELTAHDLLSQKKFPDHISQANYPVDIHGMDNLFLDDKPEGDAGKPWYEIPYGCLVARDSDNLLVAGRCAGADFVAQSAIRIQVCCRSMGEAAGIAAAMVLRVGVAPAQLDGVRVRERMVELGADFI